MVRITPTLFAHAIAPHLALAYLLLVLSSVDVVRSATITSTWNYGSGGGDGTSWSDAGNWTNSDGSHRVPDNNGGSDTFNATVPSPGDTVVLANVFVVDNLDLTGMLEIRGTTGVASNLLVVNPLTNNATIQLSSTSAEMGLAGSARLQVANGSLTNNGTLSFLFSSGINPARTLSASLINSGAVTIAGGTAVTFDQSNAVHTNTGTFGVGTGATAAFGSGTTFNMNGGTLDNEGAFIMGFNGGTFNFNGGTLSGNPIRIVGGTLKIAPALTNAGSFVLIGTLVGDIAPAQTVIIQNDSPAPGIQLPLNSATGFTNQGTLRAVAKTDLGQPVIQANTGTFVNQGLLDVQGDLNRSVLIQGNFDNQGQVDVQPGVTLSLTGPSENHGTIALGTQSALVVAQSGTLTNGADGIIEGTGTVFPQVGTVINDGTVSPGFSPGILTFRNYSQSSLGHLLIELGGTTVGTQYDQLQVTGIGATLDGLLDVVLLDSFVPSPADTFTILTAPSIVGITGTFANTPGNVLTFSGGTFDVTYTPTSVILSNFHSVPEPGTWGLAVCGSAVLFLGRCRRKAHR